MSELANEQGRKICSILEDVLKQISEEGSLLSGVVLENEECRHHRQELDRLHGALQTYLETDPSLRYIGLVGSFSSGKTATINNLLELPPDKKREEDINPVDERLTVCVHKDKIDSVVPALLKSAWQHDRFVHSSSRLANVILVDTPGGGDPKVRTDIVHNFLPICDTIVYCFNSTNPLNVNDIPILQEMNEVLRHTDFFYVYTRADNVFRKNENAPLTSDNFDEAKAAKQRDAFTVRLSEALSGITLRAPELFFISNAPPPYGVDQFKKRLLSPPGDATTLGLRKIAFFRERSSDSILAVLEILRDLRATVAELLSRAEQNHQSYNKKFEIRTEEIKAFWTGAQKTIQATSGRFKELETKHLVAPVELGALQTKVMSELELDDQIKKYVNGEFSILARELGRLAHDRFERWKSVIRERLITDGLPCQPNQGIRQTLDISTKVSISVGEFRARFVKDVYVTSEKLAKHVIENILSALVRRIRDIRSDFDRTARHCSEAELFQNERELRDGCRREVVSAVQLYASLIDLYVAGINTAGTMLLIQKAKLGGDIDFLQNARIDEEEKRETSENLIQEIFEKENQKLIAIETRCRLIPQEMKSLAGEASALAAQVEEKASEILKRESLVPTAAFSSVWDETLQPVVSECENWLERECESLVSALASKHHSIGEAFEKQKNDVISAWKRRLLWTGLSGIAVITCAGAVYYRFGMSSEQQSLSEVVVWGAAGNALWALAVFLFHKVSARRTGWIADSRAKYFKEATPDVTKELLKSLAPLPEFLELKEGCKNRFVQRMNILVESNLQGLQREIETVGSDVEAVRRKGLSLVNEYRSDWEAARKIVGELYSETDEKIGRFKNVSATFKERSIDRTRALFGERAEEFAKHIDQLEKSVGQLREAA